MIMKKLMVLVLVLTSYSAAAQQDFRSLESFRGDTLAYIDYNFEHRKQAYIGQKFEKLLADYQLEKFNLSLDETSRYLQGANGRSFVYGVEFWYRIYTSPLPNASLWVVFELPYINRVEFDDFYMQTRHLPDNEWGPMLAQRFKDMIVRDIIILDQPLLPDKHNRGMLVDRNGKKLKKPKRAPLPEGMSYSK